MHGADVGMATRQHLQAWCTKAKAHLEEQATSQWAAPVLAVAVFLALRLIFLEADPPLMLPNEMKGYELITEGTAKAHEARNWGVFGIWQTHPEDGYQFWRVQSPCWVYPIAGVFRLFGAGMLQLRLYSIIVATGGLCVLLAVASRRMRGWPLLLCGLLVATNVYDIFASRAGLLEPQVNGLLALSLLCLLLARTKPHWLFGAQWAFAAAFFTKQSALIFAPVLLLGWLMAVLRTRSRPWLHLLVLAHGVLLAWMALQVVLTDEYWRTVQWNFAHVIHDEDQFAAEVDLSTTPWGEVWNRLSDDERWEKGYLGIFPVTFPLALIELVRMAVASLRHRRVDGWELLVATWFIAAFGAMQVSAQSQLRFYMILFPPVILLAAHLIYRIGARLRLRERPRCREAALIILAFAYASVHGRSYYDWLREPSYTTVELNRRIATIIGPRAAVVIGAWAVPLTFDTKYRAYFVKRKFNSTKSTIQSFGVTHLLWKTPNGWTHKVVRRRFPRVEKLKASYDWQGWGRHRVKLYELEQPL